MVNYFSFKRLLLCHIIFFIIFTSLSYYCVKFVYGADSGASCKYLEDITEHYFHSLAAQNYQEKYNTSGSYYSPYPSGYGTGYPFGTDPYKGFPDLIYGSSVIPYGGSYGFEGAGLFTDSALGSYGGYGLYNGLGSYGFKDSYPYGGFGGLYGFENLYPYGGLEVLYSLGDSYSYGGFGGLYSVGDASDVTPVDKLIQTQASTPSNTIPSIEDPNVPSFPPVTISYIPLPLPISDFPPRSMDDFILLLPCMGIYLPSDPYNLATVSSFFPGGIYTGPVTIYTFYGDWYGTERIIIPVVCPLYTVPLGVVDLYSINYIPIIPDNNLIFSSPFVTIYGPNGKLLSGTRAVIQVDIQPDIVVDTRLL